MGVRQSRVAVADGVRAELPRLGRGQAAARLSARGAAGRRAVRRRHRAGRPRRGARQPVPPSQRRPVRGAAPDPASGDQQSQPGVRRAGRGGVRQRPQPSHARAARPARRPQGGGARDPDGPGSAHASDHALRQGARAAAAADPHLAGARCAHADRADVGMVAGVVPRPGAAARAVGVQLLQPGLPTDRPAS